MVSLCPPVFPCPLPAAFMDFQGRLSEVFNMHVLGDTAVFSSLLAYALDFSSGFIFICLCECQ